MIAVRMQQADETLNDARILMESEKGSNRTIVNRAYYAAFYALLGLLLTRNEKPRKHSGAISIFDREFIRTGIFDKRLSQCLHELFDARMEDDYVTYEPVSRQEAEAAMVMSEEFVVTIRAYLKANQFLDASREHFS